MADTQDENGLSPTMARALELVHDTNDRFVRKPGGYWVLEREAPTWNAARRERCATTQTVAALTRRGYLASDKNDEKIAYHRRPRLITRAGCIVIHKRRRGQACASAACVGSDNSVRVVAAL